MLSRFWKDTLGSMPCSMHPLLPILGIGALASCGPQQQTATAIYQDVSSPGRWDATGQVVKTYPTKEEVPNYLLEGGRLRLLIQVTQQGLLTTYVDQPDWDRTKLLQLRAAHPELKAYLSASKWAAAK